ncbi:Aluminum-activated malate transporter [Cynara cardunculus var. scolymus]|uniref:Aluminum-activated malate transporter n=1 Tax=Cynara cardunculus var. scolymus TaxID=59895 RepID=A0A118JWY5_CYNCS|nr:Aluminum-activated malate transporter [Cynara cardunculus var. scolymus]
MANKNGVQWSIRVGDGSLVVLEPEHKNRVMRLWDGLKGLVVKFAMKVWRFLKQAWDLGVDDPRKVFHCLKVGVALMVVSLFYYMRPLYDGVGGSAIWAVMTVVVVFEYTVGGTLYKCLNRICATFLAGFLALGIHWVAIHSGHRFEPYIMGISLFILASATTFSRFIPVVKARFDYGCTIFILTYSLVSVSGYRVEHLLSVAHERLSTIIIGTCLCIITSMLVFPVWAGMELHVLIPRNMDKLSKSLECASSRSCAYCIETLTSCLDSKNQVPESIKDHLSSACMNLSSSSSSVMKELAKIVSTMTRSATIDMAVQEMKNAVQELQNDLQSLPDLLIQPLDSQEESTTPNSPDKTELVQSEITVMPLMEVIPLVSFASLLMETASRIEESIVKAVEELADSAQFKQAEDEIKLKQNPTTSKIASEEV